MESGEAYQHKGTREIMIFAKELLGYGPDGEIKIERMSEWRHYPVDIQKLVVYWGLDDQEFEEISDEIVKALKENLKFQHRVGVEKFDWMTHRRGRMGKSSKEISE